jgi:hypothetical protein
MAQQYIGIKYVASYLGVTEGALHYWCKRPPEGFPEPDVEIVVTAKDLSLTKISARGWLPSSLPCLRDWYTAARGWTEEAATSHWVQVDADLKTGRKRKPSTVSPGQIELSIPTVIAVGT